MTRGGVFVLQTALHSTTPAVWLPYTEIDQLLVILKTVQIEPLFVKVHNLYYHRTYIRNMYMCVPQS